MDLSEEIPTSLLVDATINRYSLVGETRRLAPSEPAASPLPIGHVMPQVLLPDTVGRPFSRSVLLAAMLLCGMLCSMLSFPGTVQADLIELIGGGSLRGECLRDPADPEGIVRVRTLSGAVVDVPADQVARFTRRKRVAEEFDLQLRDTPRTVDSLWALAEWAREQGLKPQRAEALEALLEVDPGHVAAHRGLGHVQHEGEWMTHPQLMERKGFVKHKGKWVLPQEVELLELAELQSAEEKQWFRQIKTWLTWLKDGTRPERQPVALASLRAIREPAAIPAVARHLANDGDDAVRLLAVVILSQTEGDRPGALLVEFCLKDRSWNIRQDAIRGLQGRSVERLRLPLRKALKHEVNAVVNNAAIAIASLGDRDQIPALIDALVTDHRYSVTVPDNANTISMGTNGSFAPRGVPLPDSVANQLATGQLPQGVNVQYAPLPGEELRRRTVMVLRHEANPEVLAALQRLTGQNFGYDKAAWKAWQRRQQGAA